MISQEQVREYLERSGDDRFRWDLPILEFPGGWFSYALDDTEFNALVIWQASGDAKALLARAKELAGLFGKQKIIFATRHNGKAMARLFQGRVMASLIEIEV